MTMSKNPNASIVLIASLLLSLSLVLELVQAQKPPLQCQGVESVIGGPITIDFQLSNWWNNTQYLAYSNPNISFSSNVTLVSATQNATSTTPLIVGIDVMEHRQYQQMKGLGASVTDAAAIVLQSLRVAHPDAYDEILNLAFNQSPEWLAKGGAGMNMIRTPIGSSDFGFVEYSYDDTTDGSPDPQLTLFDINKSPKRWQTIQDILAINPELIVIASTWSPPAWMKNSTRSLGGGSILQQFEVAYCDYLVKFVRTVKSTKGITVSYLTIVNEPLYSTPNYPTTSMTAEQQARLGVLCRTKLDSAGFGNVKLLAYDHNWDNTQYAIQVFDRASQAFAGVAWHCYGGDPSGQDPFNRAYPNREVMMTECTRITQFSQESWNNLKSQFNQLILGSIDYMSSAVVLWNMALQVDSDGFTVPTVPNVCRNCLAPFLVFDNATQPGLGGANITSAPVKRHIWSKHRSSLSRRAAESDSLESAKNVGPDELNKGAHNSGQLIPPFRDTYYQTSDFVAMTHLGRALRPENGCESWAQRVGVTTTEDGFSNPRVKAQLFRNKLGNGSSRWSLILLQTNEHYQYYYASREDVTIQLRFRDLAATFVLPPGVFTMQWTAPDSKDEDEA